MKIIDCFTFYNELDLLEYRLNSLYDIIDYFIIVECIKTHNNNDNILYFNENKKRYSKYLDKIIHVIIDSKIPNTNNAWNIEKFQRDQIDIGINFINKTLNNDDIIIISDLDEIPDNNILLKIKNNNIKIDNNKIYSLEQDFYYYNITTKSENKWYKSKILLYELYNKYPNPNDIRMKFKNNYIIKNGGWHLSYFGNIKYIKNKLINFAHQEFNNEYYLNENKIRNDILNKRLYINNEIFNYIDIKNNNYLPYNYKYLNDKFNINNI